MTTLLQIDNSPLETSVSREMTRHFREVWQAAHPDGSVLYRDLAANPPKPIDALWVSAANTKTEELSATQKGALAVSDELIGELETADEYTLGVPMHNFGIPSVLKLWIDQVARRGRTFAYTPEGPVGFLTGKRVTFLIASGGVYKAGTPTGAMDFVTPYLRAVFGFLGVQEITCVTAEGAMRMLSGAVPREAFMQPLLQQTGEAATKGEASSD